jgi:hypothetical protein
MPIRICFEDELSDCHIVKAKETMESIAERYNTTYDDLCTRNSGIFSGNYCGHVQALPVGMELAVPRPYPDPPSPCREIPGYWSCYTVKANDTIWPSDLDPVGISTRAGASAAELIELNFGKNPNHCCIDYDCYPLPDVKGGCSNATACPASKGPYRECLQFGQVLTVPIAPACVPRPGVWECANSSYIVPYPSPHKTDDLLVHLTGACPEAARFS